MTKISKPNQKNTFEFSKSFVIPILFSSIISFWGCGSDSVNFNSKTLVQETKSNLSKNQNDQTKRKVIDDFIELNDLDMLKQEFHEVNSTLDDTADEISVGYTLNPQQEELIKLYNSIVNEIKQKGITNITQINELSSVIDYSNKFTDYMRSFVRITDEVIINNPSKFRASIYKLSRNKPRFTTIVSLNGKEYQSEDEIEQAILMRLRAAQDIFSPKNIEFISSKNDMARKQKLYQLNNLVNTIYDLIRPKITEYATKKGISINEQLFTDRINMGIITGENITDVFVGMPIGNEFIKIPIILEYNPKLNKFNIKPEIQLSLESVRENFNGIYDITH